MRLRLSAHDITALCWRDVASLFIPSLLIEKWLLLYLCCLHRNLYGVLAGRVGDDGAIDGLAIENNLLHAFLYRDYHDAINQYQSLDFRDSIKDLFRWFSNISHHVIPPTYTYIVGGICFFFFVPLPPNIIFWVMEVSILQHSKDKAPRQVFVGQVLHWRAIVGQRQTATFPIVVPLQWL